MRVKAIERAGGRCQICNSKNRLEVHHRVYPEVLGTENVIDLTVLCYSCHYFVSTTIQKKQVLRKQNTPKKQTATPSVDGSTPEGKSIEWVAKNRELYRLKCENNIRKVNLQLRRAQFGGRGTVQLLKVLTKWQRRLAEHDRKFGRTG